jgi:alkaline phosphatase D
MAFCLGREFAQREDDLLSCASFAKNLNYRSPSENHPSLGINLRKVHKRQAPGASYAPSQLNFTHGVASGVV